MVAGAATLLAAAPLISLFEGLGWLVDSAFAVALIVAAATGARMLRIPIAGQALAMLAALVLGVTSLFRSGEELLFLPTAGTLEHFGVLLNEVPDVVANESLPVGGSDGLRLLTVLGVGLIAILVDLLAVGLRRPALAGLPMLAVYSVPVAVHLGSVPWWTFGIGVAGYLWLLAADNLDRVRRFGRRFTGDGRDVEHWEPSPLAAVGRRLTVIGMLIAVALPLAVPGMTSGLVDRFGSGMGGSGEGGAGGSRASVNLFAALDGLLNLDATEDLVRFTTDDPDPFYLRIGVADQVTERGFDHRAPDGDPVIEGVPTPAGSRPGVTYHPHRTSVEILRWDMNRVPTFATLTGVGGLDDRWRYDGEQMVVFSGNTGASGLDYEMEHQRPEFDPDVLRRVRPLPDNHPIHREYTEIISVERVSQQVEELTDGIGSPYEQVLAILAYFSRENGFSYSLDTGSEVTGSAIEDFLFENQTGFCIQYAAGLAWMIREAGLPARVAVGFTLGSQRTENTYLLTNRNLHAWAEVYFNRIGWVPFDATPRGSIAGAADPAWAPDPNAPLDPNTPGGPNAPGTPGSPDNLPGDNLPDNLAPEPGGGLGGLPAGRSVWQTWLLAGAALVLVLLILPALRRVQLRRYRLPRRASQPVAAVGGAPAPGVVTSGEPAAAARHRAHAVWDELLDTMVDFRVPLNPAETPRVTAERLVRDCRLDSPVAADDSARLLGRAEERARYAPGPLPAAGLVGAVRMVRRALAGQSSWRVRLRAALLPPSTLLRWRTATGDLVADTALAAGRLGEALARLSPRRLLHGR
jgi:transglutaminase-like putative cysteine protease